MTNTEITTPAVEKTRCSRRGLLIGVLSVALILACLGYVGLVYAPLVKSVVPPVLERQEIEGVKQRVDALERQFNAMVQSPVQAPQPVPESGAVAEDVKKLRELVESREAVEQQAIKKGIAAAFSFWDLREEARAGRDFSLQLSALRAAGTGDAALSELVARLGPYSNGGTLTLPQLREIFLEDAKAAPAATPLDATSFWARVKAALQPLISIRRVNDPRWSAILQALAAGDLPQAVEAAKVLPEELRTHFAPWVTRAQARIELDTTLKALASYFTTAAPAEPVQENAP
jgi:hypothetical protein